jgi:His-Xaa-Ser system radical SAM maturase HxsC
MESLVGSITTENLPLAKRAGMIRLLVERSDFGMSEAEGFLAVISALDLSSLREVPQVGCLREVDHFNNGDVVVIEPQFGMVRSVYRPMEKHHSLFVTERCNSNCLMCSQPPRDRDDTAELTKRNLRIIELMTPPPTYLTITGGEPTLLGDGLFTILQSIKTRLMNTQVHMLTNGRTFAWSDFTRRLATVVNSNFSVGIPLYSDFAGDHDYIVQATGAFDQTLAGFHQLALNGVRTEVRVVLHKLTVERLMKLAEYIYRNLPFVEHIALMGLEQTGYLLETLMSCGSIPTIIVTS